MTLHHEICFGHDGQFGNEAKGEADVTNFGKLNC